MKHKIIFHKILFLVIVCIAFFGTAMIYKATKDLATAYGWKGTIEKMIDANDEVNFLLEKKPFRGRLRRGYALYGGV